MKISIIPGCFRRWPKDFLVSFLFILIPTVSVLAQRDIPEHGGQWVHDEANLLSPQTIQQLEAFLKHHRDSTSNQIAIYTINSLEGEDIDNYAFKVAEHWKLGQESKDNGVLLLISKEDRLISIQVGKGLEGALTDLESSRINRNVIAPLFRAGDYDAGIRAGVSAIVQAIQGEYVNDEPPKKKKRKNSPLFTVFLVLLIIVFLARRRGGGGGGGYWSSGGGWIPPIGGGFGSSSGSWGSGPDFGGGGGFGGGGSSDSW
jgi:uncharacterized protein